MAAPARLADILQVDPSKVHISADGAVSFDPTAEGGQCQAALLRAAELLNSNQPVAIPTETVYGLAASARSSDAVRSIYAAKNRPADNPLIVHVGSIQQLDSLLKGDPIPAAYRPLIDRCWPGPLTILLRNKQEYGICPEVSAGQPTFAVRMPVHPVARALMILSGLPLAAPSANASTRPSPTLASHVFEDLKYQIPLILDGGPCDVGVESTVVNGLVSPPLLLRPGGYSLEEIRQLGGTSWQDVVVGKATAQADEKVQTPGMKYKHYSPTAKVVLFSTSTDPEGYLSEVSDAAKVIVLRTQRFPETIDRANVTVENLGATGKEISRNLFAALRHADEVGADLVLVEGTDESNEGLAVMNRLRKAASLII
ncbi:hypothetical protein CANCADRAFT_4304 [Tortispora caseinolytica NRRL Y-17796]|uniref:Threonylcarbamoyl-AMP synthase n=1 Tax=Tortispora caseinolytica NRRL Y-17796 TaxID=767744 RepID=A0A1E4TD62_9ASCO|nr:hypothetical protein CANCADRAFT_4304 [Tortispora caseinolytica NRRL Y-17796]